MSPERPPQVEDIFHTALELVGDERAEFLDQACGDNESLRRDVESLLNYKEKPASPLESSLDDEAAQLLAESHDESLLGKTFDHFKILSRLGVGGMAEVYLAEDLRLNRKVALKLLPSIFTRDETQVLRFQQEAQAASALNHPNIITIHEIGQADSLRYIAMELIQGATLRQHLHGARLPLREALGITAQIAEALSAAHRAGIVHRDIKPENVMLRDDGYAKVLDFGIAKLKEQRVSFELKPGAASPTDTRSSLIAGTLSYMSPEQARGESLDARSDLFSLGIVLYEMVSGRRPFEGETAAAVLEAILNSTPAPLDVFRQNVPQDLAKILARALKKDREQRYQSAGEMLTDLRALRNQLESRTGGEESYESPSEFNLPPHQRQSAAARAGRKSAPWFLITGILAALAAVIDISSLHHRGFRDAGLLTLSLVCILVFARLRRRLGRMSSSTSQELAFRGLAAFHETDRERFYGRESDISALFEMVIREDFRFGVLHAASGAGKTSLLTAGLAPKLRDEGYAIVHCRSYRDPLAAVIDECRGLSGLEPHGQESAYLRRVTEHLRAEIIVICDQFEEFFVNFRTKREREPFTSFVTDCYNDANLPVKFLFSIRSDFLYLISEEFDNRIHEPLMGDRRYQLRNFDLEQSEEVIEKTARQASLPLEASLRRQVTHDLAVDDAILPSELQIVGEQLQKKKIYTLESYHRAGGKEQLVASYVEERVEATDEQEVARLLLRTLISDEDRRVRLALPEIVNRTQRGRASVERALRHFVEARLVREIQDDEPWRYELMHDYLIDKINLITGRVMDATQRANRVFRQYLSNYSTDKRTRIPINKLWFIWRYSNIQRREREHNLLRKSLQAAALKSSAAIFVLLIATSLAAAALSVREEWEGVRLSDGHTAAVRRAVFSPDGHLLVSVGEDQKVIVWDFGRRERLATLADHTNWVTSVDFSPDGRWFATGSRDKTVIVWDAKQLEKVVVLREHQAAVNAVAFSPDGRFLASASESPDDRTVVWSVGPYQKVREFPCGSAYGNLRFSPNGRWLLGSSCPSTWDVDTGRLATLEEQHGGNWSSLSPDGTRQVSVTAGGDVVFSDMSKYWDKTKESVLSRQEAHQDNGRAVAYSPDGRLVATGADDIILWDAETKTKLARLEHTAIVWSLAFSPNGRWLASSHGDGAILVWDVMERALAANLNEHGGPVRSVAFSSDGKRIASGGEDRSVIVWDTEHHSKEAVFQGHTSRIVGVAFSRDGELVASCDLHGTIILWNIRRRQPRLTFKSPSGDSYGLAISPDGRWLANSHGVYETEKGRQLVDFISGIKGTRGGVYGVAFSQDARLLACVTEFGQIFLWDAKTWQLLDRLESTGTQLIDVNFSPDGKWFVTGESEGAIRLWSVNPLREEAIIGRHSARIKSVAFSPDGRQIASAGDDQSIALWDVQRRSLITYIGTHSAPVLSVAFSPDGKRLVSGEHDKSVRLYTRHHGIWGYRVD